MNKEALMPLLPSPRVLTVLERVVGELKGNQQRGLSALKSRARVATAVKPYRDIS